MTTGRQGRRRLLWTSHGTPWYGGGGEEQLCEFMTDEPLEDHPALRLLEAVTPARPAIAAAS